MGEVTTGHFYTLIGYEVVAPGPYSNFFYTNSYSGRTAPYWGEFNNYLNDYSARSYAYDLAEDVAAAGPPNVLVSSSSTKVTISVPGGNGYRLDIIGTGLTTNGKGYLTGGTVTDFKFYDAATGKGTDFRFQFATSATDLVDAAQVGSGKFNPQNYKAFFDLISPTYLFGSGSKTGDVFSGHTGDDQFSGKGGSDMMFLGVGNDVFNGGKGIDVINAVGAQSKVTAKLGPGTFESNEGTTTGTSVENFLGSRFNDTIVGNGKGNTLFGNKGADVIKGQGGNDMLVGGKGKDKLKGGKGKDKFVFLKKDGTDTVLDFQDGKDKLMLKKFGFKSKKAALKHFYELGGPNDDKVGFDYKGTKIIIKGADLKDIDVTDILI